MKNILGCLTILMLGIGIMSAKDYQKISVENKSKTVIVAALSNANAYPNVIKVYPGGNGEMKAQSEKGIAGTATLLVGLEDSHLNKKKKAYIEDSLDKIISTSSTGKTVNLMENNKPINLVLRSEGQGNTAVITIESTIGG